ncbi:MAG TPA: PEGA domain-containing protein [Gemmataceae bacterium]|nr:PEGA domain-containing protein [Gemmataceae bacterium]
MRRRVWLPVVLLAAGLAGGCVERKYTVYTDPPNVLVLVNNTPLGPSPADGSFVYYGKYTFTLMAPGYETLHVTEDIRAPWYEWWPLDFFFETLWPFEIEDVRTFHYQMMPTAIPNTEELLRRSGQVREQGRAIRPAQAEPAAPIPETPPPDQASPAAMPREGER